MYRSRSSYRRLYSKIDQLGPYVSQVSVMEDITTAGTADMAAAVVLSNTVIVGSVNANKRQWFRAGQTLQKLTKSGLQN